MCKAEKSTSTYKASNENPTTDARSMQKKNKGREIKKRMLWFSSTDLLLQQI